MTVVAGGLQGDEAADAMADEHGGSGHGLQGVNVSDLRGQALGRPLRSTEAPAPALDGMHGEVLA